jgi:cyclohexanone monooxygenase
VLEPRANPKTSAPDGGGDLDAVVVGAGFAGLYMLVKLRELGLAARVYEMGSGVGGTWFWNRYPGARCDVESLDYQYSFSPELLRDWTWTERYPAQEEILRYLDHVADRFDLRRDIQLETRVSAAAYDEAAGLWEVSTDRGDRVRARFCIMATGCLSIPKEPDFPGLDTFAGDWYLTARWPDEDVDFSGKRVAVVGTGSSGIQVIPVLAEQASELLVFQRTASFSVPAFNGPLDPELQRDVVASFDDRRRYIRESVLGLSCTANPKSALEVSADERERELEARWRHGGLVMYGAFSDLLVSQEANDKAAEYFRAKIRGTVHDPRTAELLTPRGYPLGTKRICVNTGYYETFNAEHVTLVDLGESPLREITPKGIVAGDREYEVDCIVFALGFDAMTGALLAIDVRGRAGQTLADKWHAGPRTYLGIGIAGFPNLFLVTGPGSPSVFSNVVVSIEQHVDWIADAIEDMRIHGLRTIEPSQESEDEWVGHVNEVANATLAPLADSWYMGANVPGKPRVFMPYLGGVGPYRRKCDEVAADGYAGFARTP